MKNQAYRMAMLFDFYGDLLTDRQKEFYDLYYNEDLSLAEIAENYGISRQGVRDVIVRAEAAMTEIEDKTHIIRRFYQNQTAIAAIDQAADELLKAVDERSATDELLDRSPFELSGGQKRRAAIAGVMAMRPEILILDEPAAGLDPRGRLEILDEIEGYHRQSGTTVLLVSHSMEDIARYADRVLVISNGRLFDYGTVEEVFRTAARLEENGLSVPQITELFLELERRGIHFDESVYTVKYAEKLLLAALKGGERP